MPTVITDSFELIIAVLRRVGLYHEKKSKLKQIWAYFLYVSSVVVIALTFVNIFVEENGDFMVTNQMVLFLAEGAAGCVKLLPFLTNGKKIRECIDFFGDEQFAPKNEEERRIQEECVGVCRKNCKIYFFIMMFTEVCWGLLPFLEKEKRRLAVNVWLPVDLQELGAAVFCALYIYVVAVCSYMGFVSEMVEPLIGGLVYHATCQLKILKYNLRNLCRFAKEDSVRFEDVSEIVKNCVIHHNQILDFTNKFEDCFSFPVLCQFAGAVFGLCFCCMGLTLVPVVSTFSVLFVTCYIVLVFQLLFYCHYGTLLFQENEDLITSVYMGNWYLYDVRVRKMFIIIMERSKKSINLRAGKVVKLTYATFTSVLKTSYSLIAVMNNYK